MAEVFPTIAGFRSRVSMARQQGAVIGFVPTMGALHAGHATLMEAAKRECDFVAASIFVNPTQFNNEEDYKKYARDLPVDLEICARHGVDAVFVPSVEEMYPAAQETFIEVPEVSRNLCGVFRPGHFRGVATVVAKLFHIAQPDVAFFGEKDAQQLAVIRRMTAELNFPIAIRGIATVREEDGLALSSRNVRLTPAERHSAPALFRALSAAKASIEGGCRDAASVKRTGLAVLAEDEQIQVEYFEIAGADSMQPVDEISGSICIAGAIWLGAVRLIDNVMLLVE